MNSIKVKIITGDGWYIGGVNTIFEVYDINQKYVVASDCSKENKFPLRRFIKKGHACQIIAEDERNITAIS